MSKKLAVELSEELYDKITDLSKDRVFNAATKFDVIRHALSLYLVSVGEVRNGNRLAVTDKNGAILKELVITI